MPFLVKVGVVRVVARLFDGLVHGTLVCAHVARHVAEGALLRSCVGGVHPRGAVVVGGERAGLFASALGNLLGKLAQCVEGANLGERLYESFTGFVVRSFYLPPYYYLPNESARAAGRDIARAVVGYGSIPCLRTVH